MLFLRFATNVGFAQLLLYATIGDSFFCIERLFNQPLKKPGSYRMSQEATEKVINTTGRSDRESKKRSVQHVDQSSAARMTASRHDGPASVLFSKAIAPLIGTVQTIASCFLLAM